MSISNRQLLAAVLALYKSGQLNETVLTMAMDRPSLLVKTDPKSAVRAFTVGGSSLKYYINSNWFPKIRQNLRDGNKISAIKLIRIVAGNTPERAMNNDVNIKLDCWGYPVTAPGWAPDCGLADSKYLAETGDFS